MDQLDLQEQRELVSCDLCQRKFFEERLPDHRKACQRLQGKTRKVFNSKQYRLDGLELTQTRVPDRSQLTKRKPNWRTEHDHFIKNIRGMRKNLNNTNHQSEQLDNEQNDLLVQCGFCQRRFDPFVAKRHIPNCQNIINRPKPPKSKISQIQEPLQKQVQKQTNDSALRFPSLNVRIADRIQTFATVECPTCNRKFQTRAAERHIPICQKLTMAAHFNSKLQKKSKILEEPPKTQSNLLPHSGRVKASSKNKSDVLFCVNCGGRFELKHRYCGYCGKKRAGDS